MTLRPPSADRHDPLPATRYVVIVVTVIAPAALGAGVAAARITGSAHTLAVMLAATIFCGLISGLLVAPGLRSRMGERPAVRPRAGRGPGGL